VIQAGRRRTNLGRILLASLGVLVALIRSDGACAEQLYPKALYPSESLDISLPHFELGPDESIGYYHCELTSARILKAKTAYVWSTSINNGERPGATIEAVTIIGGGGLRRDDLPFFDRFLTVAKLNPKPHENPLIAPFDVTVELGIMKGDDTDHSKPLKFTMKQLVIQPSR
jgi:hypothetical protein